MLPDTVEFGQWRTGIRAESLVFGLVSWVRLIRKVYEADPLTCPKCGKNMKVIAVITDPKQAKRIATHLGAAPYRAPPPFYSDTNLTKQLQIAA